MVLYTSASSGVVPTFSDPMLNLSTCSCGRLLSLERWGGAERVAGVNNEQTALRECRQSSLGRLSAARVHALLLRVHVHRASREGALVRLACGCVESSVDPCSLLRKTTRSPAPGPYNTFFPVRSFGGGSFADGYNTA